MRTRILWIYNFLHIAIRIPCSAASSTLIFSRVPLHDFMQQSRLLTTRGRMPAAELSTGKKARAEPQRMSSTPPCKTKLGHSQGNFGHVVGLEEIGTSAVQLHSVLLPGVVERASH